ncbi:MAG: Competence protein ComEA helix-hairpin-helix repeat protein [Bacillota bacterium]|nr:MAG: Competence protein ComEA helix-hairpin-helix repeat protein [Bacillota bacterium]MBS3949755.1 ComEA family DNA-binding protein [Peptococcaceae bacterium]
MQDRGMVIGLAIIVVLSLSINVYLFVALQRSPEVIYLEAPKQDIPEATEESPVVVYISGAVVRPSVYSLPAGSRVLSVLETAGGALADADLERINLARVLVDGEQVHIYIQGDPSAPVLAASNTTIPTNAQVNINTATQAQLETLPGIGPVKAGDIITYRTQNGPFKKIEDIMNVKGIGEKTFESLKDLIRIN